MKWADSKQLSTSPVWEVPKLQRADEAELRLCKSEQEAFRLMIDSAPQGRKGVQIDMDLSSSHMTQIIDCTKGVKVNRLGNFCRAAQNIRYLQKVAWDLGFELIPRQWTVYDKAAAFDAMTTERAELAQRSG